MSEQFFAGIVTIFIHYHKSCPGCYLCHGHQQRSIIINIIICVLIIILSDFSQLVKRLLRFFAILEVRSVSNTTQSINSMASWWVRNDVVRFFLWQIPK